MLYHVMNQDGTQSFTTLNHVRSMFAHMCPSLKLAFSFLLDGERVLTPNLDIALREGNLGKCTQVFASKRLLPSMLSMFVSCL